MSNDIQLVNLDRETLLTEAKQLKNTIPELAEWDFENQNDVLKFILDFYVGSLERSAAWANALAQEFNIATAQARDNVINHATQLGYVPTNRVSSTVDIDITHDDPPSNETIQAGDLLISARGKDGSKVYFQNKENFTILNGSTSISGVPFVEGETRERTFNSSGDPFQTFTITDGIAQGSISVTVDDVEWTEVDTFEILSDTDERYRLRTLNETTYQIIFGDGSEGKIPTEGSEIIISYRKGGGIRGNVGADKVITIEENPSEYITAVTNPSPATGGTNPESTEEIRYSAVRVPRLNNRIVSLNDVESYGDAYDGVSRTKAFSNFNSPLVYIIPDGGGTPSSSLKTDLQEDINDIVVLGHFVSVLDPQYKTVNLELDIVLNPSYARSSVETNVTNELTDLIDPLHKQENGIWSRGFGDPLKVSEVVSTAKGVDGVMAVEITNPTPTPGDDTLVDCNDDEIVTNVGSSISLNSIISKDYEGTKNRSVKELYINPKYNS